MRGPKPVHFPPCYPSAVGESRGGMKEEFYLAGLGIPLISAAEAHLSAGKGGSRLCGAERSFSLMFISSPSEQVGAVANRFIIQ